MALRIFVTTDNHVGFNELDPVRCNDAANTFEEVMTIAENSAVDFAIQGGDLFHVNKPSKQAMYSVMKTLRKTCLGDKPIEFEVLNHGPLTLQDAADEFDHPNFEDPNFNVSLPVFAISGNHDDVGGSANSNLTSPLDVLSMAGLINHFGRIHDSANITVTPILIAKNGIRVALYGMASVRDERLYRTFRDNKVRFLRPREEPDTWYNILVVHQNRTPHGPTNYLPEQFLPNFMDLVIWGHEHECLIDPMSNTSKGFKVMQPGSSVATSLSASETDPKHVAIITIAPNKLMSYEKIMLKTVRPFAQRTVTLAYDAPHIDSADREVRAKVTAWLMEQVDQLIDEACESWRETHVSEVENGVEPPLPLIRLRVDYSGGYDVENTARFSNRFVGRVANSSDILHLIKKHETTGGRLLPKSSSAGQEVNSNNNNISTTTNGIEKVGQLVRKNLNAEQLQILRERGMRNALSQFVEKDEKSALRVGVDSLVNKKVEELLAQVNIEELVAQPIQKPTDYSEPGRLGSFVTKIASPVKKKPARRTRTPATAASTSVSPEPMDVEIPQSNSVDDSEDEQSAPIAGTRAHPTRSSRLKAGLNKPPEPVPAANQYDDGDDDDKYDDESEPMFSSDDSQF